MFLNPRTVREYDARYYEEYSEKSGMAGGRCGEVAGYLRRRLERAEEAVGRGKLLEIGFGEGLFLNLAKSRGWEVYGVEASAWATEEAKRRFGLRHLYNAPLHELRFGDSCFNFIHMNHTLEHMPDPVETMVELRRIARPGALVAIEVPNEFGSLMERVKGWAGKRREPYAVPSTHLWFFTPATLAHLAKKTGFTVRQLRTVRRDKERGSRYPGGVFAKRLIYLMEDLLRRGPLIELWARRPRG